MLCFEQSLVDSNNLFEVEQKWQLESMDEVKDKYELVRRSTFPLHNSNRSQAHGLSNENFCKSANSRMEAAESRNRSLASMRRRMRTENVARKCGIYSHTQRLPCEESNNNDNGSKRKQRDGDYCLSSRNIILEQMELILSFFWFLCTFWIP